MNRQQKIQMWIRDMVEENYYPELRIMAAMFALDLSERHGVEFSELEAVLTKDSVVGGLELEFLEDRELFLAVNPCADNDDPYLDVLRPYEAFHEMISEEGDYSREEMEDAFRSSWPSLRAYSDNLGRRSDEGLRLLRDLLRTEVYGDQADMRHDPALVRYAPDEFLHRFVSLHIFNSLY